jgi:hypothetical protein
VEVLEAKALLSGGGLKPEIFRIHGGSTRFDQIDLAKTGIVFTQHDTGIPRVAMPQVPCVA